MKKSKRSIIYLLRHPSKSATIFSLIFIIGIMISGAVSLQRAVTNTERNLHRTLPPMATIAFDHTGIREFDDIFLINGGTWEELIEWHIDNPQTLTNEMLQELINFPAVTDFDFTVLAQAFSTEVYHYDMGEWLSEREQVAEDEFIFRPSQLGRDSGIFPLQLKGVGSENFLDLRAGLIEITAGRSFNEMELMTPSETVPVLVSNIFATINNLSTSSQFTMANGAFDERYRMEINWNVPFEHIDWSHLYNIDNAVFWTEYTFEVIGIFEISQDVNPRSDYRRELMLRELAHQIYVPALFAAEISSIQWSYMNQNWLDAGLIDEVLFAQNQIFSEQSSSWSNVLFVLENPDQLTEFIDFGSGILPDFFNIADMSFAYGGIMDAIQSSTGLLTIFLTVAVIALLVILGLVILLYLKDRQKEYAIYLAIGCKKLDLFWQTAMEILIPSSLALLLSLFIGNVATSELSRVMMISELTSQQERYDHSAHATNVMFTEYGPIYYDSGLEILEWFTPSFDADEMIEAFDMTMTPFEVLNILGIGIAVILLATLLSVIYIIHLDPKELLANPQ